MSLNFFNRVVTASLALLIFSQPVLAQSFSQDLQKALSQASVKGLAFEDKRAFEDFYKERGYAPLWRDEDDREEAIDILAESWRHGFHPAQYNVNVLSSISKSDHVEDLAPREAMFSAAVVKYARDLTGMRVPASSINQIDSFWRQPLSAYTVLSHIAKKRDAESALRDFAPRNSLYSALQDELIVQIKRASNPDEIERLLPLSFGGTLKPGDYHRRVNDLRLVLGMRSEPQNEQYDDRLLQAVMAFQQDNGLETDGILGPQTLEALNRTALDKIKQVIANLERLRWQEPNRPGKYLIVNIPAQTLWAIEDGQTQLEMPVIVGRPGRETMSFVTRVTGVRFNPTWTVPRTIKFEDYVPKLKKDPLYMEGKNVRFIRDGQTLNPSSINWNELNASEISRISMVQAPGSNNPLGYIRLLMPNRYNIYLHDTNAAGLFAQSLRTESSGCVRMSEPRAVASFILKDNAGWSDQNIDNYLSGGEMSDIPAENPIPAYLLYQSIWQDAGRGLVYSNDIYGWDERLFNELESRNEVFVPRID